MASDDRERRGAGPMDRIARKSAEIDAARRSEAARGAPPPALPTRAASAPARAPSPAPAAPEAAAYAEELASWSPRQPSVAAPPPPSPPPPAPAPFEEEPSERVERAPPKTALTRPFAAFEWVIAGRYLRARRKEGFISVVSGLSLVGIALGVAAIIVVVAVMTGFREELVKQILGVNPHASVLPQSEVRSPFVNYDELSQRLKAVPGVIQAAPTVEGQVMGSSPAGNALVVVRGVRLEDFKHLKPVAAPEQKEGALDSYVSDKGVAIGQRLAFKLGLRVGDKITLVSPDGNVTPFGVTPRVKSYKIIYTFRIGMSEYDEVLLYMPLDEAQIYFNREDAQGKPMADALDVMVENPQEIERYEPALTQAAGQPLSIFTWKNRNATLIGALNMEKLVMRVILSLIIIIAAFNVIAGLIMLVKEKSRDVAILRTMGLSRGAVMRIFFICGASVGVIGALIGLILGVAVALNIGPIQSFVEWLFGVETFSADLYFLSRLPSRLLWGDVAITMLIALSISFFATLWPARRAARLDPVEALRYE